MDCCVTTFLFGFAAFSVLCLILSFLFSNRKTYPISGKHILITGGSSGIGRCIAANALQRGASMVTLIARNKDKLVSVKEELESKQRPNSNQCINIISADVSKKDVGLNINKALADMKPVDVLINSAGITHTDGFLQTGQEVFESIMNTNFMGTVEVTRAILPSMMYRQEGCIVFVSSQAAQFPLYGFTAYAPSKFALRGFAEVLQMEVKPYNIKVMVSYPPDTETPQLVEEIKHRSPLVAELATYGAMFKPEQISSEILNGVERGQFNISHGFDGFMLKTLTAGVSPITSLFELIMQISLTGLFRLIVLWHLRQFNSIVCRNLKKTS